MIAGNHDLRLWMGLNAVLNSTVSDLHFFVRMMPKVLPLFIEALGMPEAGLFPVSNLPNEASCRDLLMPPRAWAEAFKTLNAGRLSGKAIQKELDRTAKKVEQLPQKLRECGLSFRQLYRATQVCRFLFLNPQGRYAWFFREMKLIHREGSFVFVHAGLCNEVASLLSTEGCEAINTKFDQLVHSDDLSAVYFGPLFNTVRTKYRDTDYDLTQHNVEQLFACGIHAVVHGHRSRQQGQRLTLRKGIIHFEADITLDINSRRNENLQGQGAGALVIDPSGEVRG
ncbi:MAG: hypothetical protein R3194_10210, partial [Limnobacter sp.]|nr:hypothetical protein [Limnobacter sp.]